MDIPVDNLGDSVRPQVTATSLSDSCKSLGTAGRLGTWSRRRRLCTGMFHVKQLAFTAPARGLQKVDSNWLPKTHPREPSGPDEPLSRQRDHSTGVQHESGQPRAPHRIQLAQTQRSRRAVDKSVEYHDAMLWITVWIRSQSPAA